MDVMGVGLTILGFSAPITAAIIKLMPRRENGNGNGHSKYVSVREFDDLKNTLRVQHMENNARFTALERLIEARL